MDNNQLNRHLYLACKYNCIRTVKLIFKKHINSLRSQDVYESLGTALSKRNTDVSMYIINNYPINNYSGILYLAIVSYDYDLVKYIFEKINIKFDLNLDNILKNLDTHSHNKNTYIKHNLNNIKIKILELLLSKEYLLDSLLNQYTFLIVTYDAYKIIFDNNYYVKYKTEQKFKIALKHYIRYIIKSDDVERFIYVINKFKDIISKTKLFYESYGILDIACLNNSINILNILLDKNLIPDNKDDSKFISSFLYSVKNRYKTEVIELLLNNDILFKNIFIDNYNYNFNNNIKILIAKKLNINNIKDLDNYYSLM